MNRITIFVSCILVSISCSPGDSYSSWVNNCIDQAPTFPFTMVKTGEVRIAREIDYDLLIGAPLPAFIGTTLRGQKVNLRSLKDKPTMINFWSMRCLPCIQEFPDFNNLVYKYEDQVDFLSFTSDQASEVDSLMAVHPFLFDIVPDAKSIIEDDFMRFWSYPFTFVADKENRIVYVLDYFGSGDSKEVELITLDSLLSANL